MAGLLAGSELTAGVLVRRGRAGELHGEIEPAPGDLQVRLCIPDRPAIVLGSRQNDALIDTDLAAASKVDVVRRRSGGGAVFVSHQESIWIDIVVPATDRRFGRDVRRDMETVGETWTSALVELGADRELFEVHHGALDRSAWSDVLCFAGVGPGEVLIDGRKLVGISQRRTRAFLRFQTQVHLVDPTDRMAALLTHRPSGEPMRPALLADALLGDVDAMSLASAIAGHLG